MIASFAEAVKEMRADLKKVYREVLPEAAAAALNQTAWQTRDLLKDDMSKAFVNPTPQTLRGMLVKRATPDHLTAIISIKDNSPRSKSGPPVGHYLAAEIEGGQRVAKSSEVALRLAGVMENQQFMIPGRAAIIDSYGNMKRGQIVQVLSSVKAYSEQGYMANVTARSAARKKGLKSRQTRTPYFIAKAKGTGQPLGIWEIVSKGVVKPVMIFANKPPAYGEARFPYFDLAERHIRMLFPAELEKALREFAAK